MKAKEFDLTPEEREALYFIPQTVGGRVVSEAIQRSLQEKGLLTPIREDGRRWLTLLGDQVRRGRR
ncbi:hypothetical protein [Roseateles sp.]|uniref:hypothetical protein n=1 Tax=Roseateles sp. TaxID=1971397 RepID=UPI0039E8A036